MAESLRPSTSRLYDEKIHGVYYPPRADGEIPERYERITRLATGLNLGESTRVLEIGSETPAVVNFWTRRLGVKPENASFVEISSRSVQLLKSGGYRAQQLDVSRDSLPFQPASFDLVILSEVLEHLVDPDHALDEIHSVLAAEGALILTTPNLAAWFNRIQLLLGFQPIFTETGTSYVFGRGPLVSPTRPVGHLQIYTREAVHRILELHCFRVISCGGMPLPRALARRGTFRQVDRIFSRFPGLAAGFIVSAVPSKTSHSQPRESA